MTDRRLTAFALFGRRPLFVSLAAALSLCVFSNLNARDFDRVATAPKQEAASNSDDQAAGDGAAPDAALIQKTFRVDVSLGDGRQLKGRIRLRLRVVGA